jgi:predicted O-methyltransferase YrrM
MNKDLLNYNWFNFASFYDWISEKQYKRMAEVGVWKGHSISHLAYYNKDAEIYAIDLFEDSDIEKYEPDLKRHVENITKIYNEYLTLKGTRDLIKDIRACSWEAASLFEDEYFDFVFIDADHEYSSVKKDIEAWFPKVRKGGILAGHDYPNWEGVKKAVDEYSENNKIKTNLFKNVNVWYYEI